MALQMCGSILYLFTGAAPRTSHRSLLHKAAHCYHDHTSARYRWRVSARGESGRVLIAALALCALIGSDGELAGDPEVVAAAT